MRTYIKEAVILFSLFLLGNCTVYEVDEYERVVVLQFSEPIKEVVQPGLYLKWPYPIQSAESLEKRYILYDSKPTEVITGDKKTLLTDAFALFRIVDGIKYLQATQTAAAAQMRVDDVIYAEIRNILGENNAEEIVTGNRAGIMDSVTRISDQQLADYGLECLIVRMNRVDLPQENKASVHGRMIAERTRQAKLYRAEGEETATKTQAEADKQVTILLAEAQRQAETIRGEGDAEATRIYNEAYGRDPRFFALFRGLEAARKSLDGKSGNVKWILSGDEPHIQSLFRRR